MKTVFKKKVLLCILLLMISVLLSLDKSYAIMTWQNSISLANGELQISKIVSSIDGGYFASAITNSPDRNRYDISIIKIDPTGNVKWQKSFYQAKSDIPRDLQSTSDGGCVLTTLNNSGIIKFDSNGNIQWQRKILTAGGRSIVDPRIRQLADGDFIIISRVCGYSSLISDLLVVKLDREGKIIWSNLYDIGPYGADRGENILQTTDGGFVLTGSNTSYNGPTRVFLLKLDENGRVEWQKVYGSGSRDWVKSTILSANGGYVLAGVTPYSSQLKEHHWVFETDSMGEIVWQRGFDGIRSWNGEADNLVKSADGGYLIAGKSHQVYLLKLNEFGNKDWFALYGNFAFTDILATSDAGYIISRVFPNGSGSKVSKLDAKGNGCAEGGAIQDIVLSENKFLVSETKVTVSQPIVVASLLDYVPEDIAVGSNLSCVSARPQIVVDALSLTYGFGAWEIGSTDVEMALIVNEGDSNLDIFQISISGADADQFSLNSDCSTLIPGTSCSLDVTFTPTSLGEKKATLKILSNDPDQPVVELQLAGEGVDTKPPVISIESNLNLLWPPNHKMVEVLVNGETTDDGSGLASVDITVADEYGKYNLTLPGFGASVALEAWRDGKDRDGRVYTFTAVATDNAGNTSTATTQVLVPHELRN